VLGLWLFDLITTVGSIVLGQAAMGGGDAKLAAMLGAWLWFTTGWVPCLWCRRICGWSCDRIGSTSAGNRSLGPFLGAVITLFGGEAILSAYLRLVFQPPELLTKIKWLTTKNRAV